MTKVLFENKKEGEVGILKLCAWISMVSPIYKIEAEL